MVKIFKKGNKFNLFSAKDVFELLASLEPRIAKVKDEIEQEEARIHKKSFQKSTSPRKSTPRKRNKKTPKALENNV